MMMAKLYNSASAIRHGARIPGTPEKIFTFLKYSEMTGYQPLKDVSKSQKGHAEGNV
jgi:hypothetical protein